MRFPVAAEEPVQKKRWSVWRFGPGIVTGSANLDPSAVVTATIAGAAFAHSLLWVVIVAVPFLLAIFSVTSRIGVETGLGLLDLVRDHYGRKFAIAGAMLTIATNLAVVIADIMAVSDAVSILTGLSRMFFVAATAFFVWYILVFQDYQKITRALVLFSLPLYLYGALTTQSPYTAARHLSSENACKLRIRGQHSRTVRFILDAVHHHLANEFAQRS